MANVSVLNMEGKEVGSMELNDAVFGVEINEHLVHLAAVGQLANKRQGTQKAKTRPWDLLDSVKTTDKNKKEAQDFRDPAPFFSFIQLKTDLCLRSRAGIQNRPEHPPI